MAAGWERNRQDRDKSRAGKSAACLVPKRMENALNERRMSVVGQPCPRAHGKRWAVNPVTGRYPLSVSLDALLPPDGFNTLKLRRIPAGNFATCVHTGSPRPAVYAASQHGHKPWMRSEVTQKNIP